MRKSLPISGYMDLRGDLLFFPFLYVICALLLRFANNIQHSLLSSMKQQLISLPVNVVDITVVPEICSRLKEQCQASKIMIFDFKVPFYLQFRMKFQYSYNLKHRGNISFLELFLSIIKR
jgi:hypothetical protein